MNPVSFATHDYSSTQFNLPDDFRSEVIVWAVEHISTLDLLEDKCEHDTHVTIKYGIDGPQLTKLRDTLYGVSAVDVTLGPMSVFHNDKQDVLYISVNSPALTELNQAISDELRCVDTQPTYTPHCTVAYLNSGAGSKYEGILAFTGRQFSFDEVVYSSKNEKPTTVPLLRATFSDDEDIFDRSEHGSVYVEPAAQREVQRIFGHSLLSHEFHDIVGAPSTSKVQVHAIDHGLRVLFHSDRAYALRYIIKNDSGKKWIDNVSMVLGTTGRGFGTKIFTKQVSTAIKEGFDYIRTETVGMKSDDVNNGAYAWARLGYNIKLNPRTRQLASDVGFGDVSDTHGLFSKPGGAEWWRENRENGEGIFDLSPGSLSLQMLHSYIKAKGPRP